MPINLVAVGHTRTYQCQCHARIHSGEIKRDELLQIVSGRENMSVAAIIEEIHRLRALDKSGNEVKRRGT